VGEMIKRDGTMWSQSALVELSRERALMGWLDPRHGNAQEAEGGRVAFLFL